MLPIRRLFLRAHEPRDAAGEDFGIGSARPSGKSDTDGRESGDAVSALRWLEDSVLSPVRAPR